MKRDGVVAHVYAGPNEGHTLAKALQLCGGEATSIVEIDVLRGPDHDMLLNQGPYAGLLRCSDWRAELQKQEPTTSHPH